MSTNSVVYDFVGPTGVGKSATISSAAKLTGNELIRFNMSSRISIDDLLGKIVLVTGEGGREEFQFSPGPFTVAFQEGKWLLLDELNLAQDTGMLNYIYIYIYFYKVTIYFSLAVH